VGNYQYTSSMVLQVPAKEKEQIPALKK
jgi:hypothetical protein